MYPPWCQAGSVSSRRRPGATLVPPWPWPRRQEAVPADLRDEPPQLALNASEPAGSAPAPVNVRTAVAGPECPRTGVGGLQVASTSVDTVQPRVRRRRPLGPGLGRCSAPAPPRHRCGQLVNPWAVLDASVLARCHADRAGGTLSEYCTRRGLRVAAVGWPPGGRER